MNYDDFITELRAAGLTGRAFARLLHLNENSISNYKIQGEVPSHLAVIAVLVRRMNDAGLDYKATIGRVPLLKKASRGRSITSSVERGPNTPEVLKVVSCPRCGGGCNTNDGEPCGPCDGTGKVKDR